MNFAVFTIYSKVISQSFLPIQTSLTFLQYTSLHLSFYPAFLRDYVATLITAINVKLCRPSFSNYIVQRLNFSNKSSYR